MSEEINGNVLKLAKKLKALADRGVGGEKENATAMLQRLMGKHGITMEMLTENEAIKHKFTVQVDQYKFWRQVVANVLGSSSVNYIPAQKGRKRSYFVVCTPQEAVEIQARFEFFYKIWTEELDVFYSAFIQTNRLYKKPSGEDNDEEEKELTPEEEKKLCKMANMMAGMDRHIFTKQIGNK
jgi:hypothetical protein